jgi:hypothetical protein
LGDIAPVEAPRQRGECIDHGEARDVNDIVVRVCQRANPVRSGLLNIELHERAAIQKIGGAYLRSSMMVSESGLPLILIGG